MSATSATQHQSCYLGLQPVLEAALKQQALDDAPSLPICLYKRLPCIEQIMTVKYISA